MKKIGINWSSALITASINRACNFIMWISADKMADEHFFLKDEQIGRRSMVILSFNSINPPVIDLNDRDTSYGISRQTRHHEELSATIDCSAIGPIRELAEITNNNGRRWDS